MADTMSLTREQRDYFPLLKTGQAILTAPGLNGPVLIETPRLPE